MNFPANEHKPQVESVSPNKIVLNARGIFPRDVEIVDTKTGAITKYRIVKTNLNKFMLNK
jgi:hypothetical protein